MGYFSNPNFMYLQDRGNYSKKQIDEFIISAYKKGKKKVVHGNNKYVVDKEIDRIRKYKKFHEPKINNIIQFKKNTIKSYKNKGRLNSKKLKKYEKNLKKYERKIKRSNKKSKKK